MSDKYVKINGFRYGLDTRREVLDSLPGSLITCNNGRINAGGSVVQRKAFVVDDNLYPPDTFGLQDTDTGLVTFGSKPAGVVGSTSPLPSGVSYQLLVKPPTAVDVTDVLYSCNFQGKAFVVAKHDTVTALYYDGALIKASVNGLVLDTNLRELSAELAALVNDIDGWLAIENTSASQKSDSTGYHLVSGGGVSGPTLVMSPPSVHFTPTLAKVSTNGVFGAYMVDQKYAGIPTTAAYAAFTLTGGASGSITLTAPAKSDGTGTAAVTGGAVAFNTSLAQTATDIGTAVNSNTYLTGYSAKVSGTTVTVFAPIAWGNFAFNLTVTEVTITTAAGTSGAVVVNANPVSVSVVRVNNKPLTVSGSCAITVSGATGAVTYTWTECNADGSTVTTASGIAISSTTSASVSFSKHLNVNSATQGWFKCHVADAGTGSTDDVIVSVQLELDSSL